MPAAGRMYALESGRCYVCNRTLTTPESVAAGIGPVCAERIAKRLEKMDDESSYR